MWGIAYGAGVFVAVGEPDATDAQILTSSDGITWTERANPQARRLYGITWNGSIFCAVGGTASDVYIITSPDGTTWTERTPPTTTVRLWSVTWSDSLFCAVGRASAGSPYILTSPDGITWTSRTTTASTDLKSVTWGNGLFVATGDADATDGLILTSPDGITWTERDNPKAFDLTNVQAVDNGFYASGEADGTDGYLIFSSDGIVWEEISNLKNFAIYDVAQVGDYIVCVGAADGTDAYIFTKGIFQTWTERSNPKNFNLYGITWSGTQFCAVGAADGTDAYIITSPDGTTWTERPNPSNYDLNDIAWGNNKYVAVGADAGSQAYLITSPDGITWTAQSNTDDDPLNSIIWTNQFVAVGDDDGTDAIIVTSPDGETWTERSPTTAVAVDLNDLVYGDQYVAVGDADGTDGYILTSDDAITWTERSNPKNFALFSVVWNGTTYCAVGAADGTDAYIITSTDGITWTERENPANIGLNKVIWNGSVFIAVGDDDTNDAYLVTSSDGVTWTERQNGKAFDLNSIAWNGETFVAVGDADGTDAYILTAPNVNAEILGGHDWNHDGATQRTVVLLSDGTLLKDSGDTTFPVTLDTGLTVTDCVPQFVEGGKEAAANNRKLFVFTGKNVVQVLSADGATTADITTPPADWATTNQPYFGLTHEGRLWGGGNDNDPHRLYYSLTTDHEDFTTAGAGTIAVYPGEGERLVGAVSFKGFIICFKYPEGIYAVDTTNVTVANWKVKRISKKIGAAWYGCIEQVEDDIYFMDRNGEIRTLSSIQEFGDVGTTSVTDLHKLTPFIRDTLSFKRNNRWRMAYYATKKELHFAVTSALSVSNDARLVIDFNDEIPRFRYSPRDNCVSLWTREVDGLPELQAGTNGGYIYRLDWVEKNKDSAGYEAKFQIPWISLGNPVQKKVGKFIEFAYLPTDSTLNFDVLWDGVKYDSFTVDLSAEGTVVTGSIIQNRKVKITGSGKWFSLSCYNSTANEDFSIDSIYLHYTTGES